VLFCPYAGRFQILQILPDKKVNPEAVKNKFLAELKHQFRQKAQKELKNRRDSQENEGVTLL
jgi:hypothetical protein